MASRFLICHRPNGQGLRRLTSHSQKFEGGAKVDAKIAKGDAREAAKGDAREVAKGDAEGVGVRKRSIISPNLRTKSHGVEFPKQMRRSC